MRMQKWSGGTKKSFYFENDRDCCRICFYEIEPLVYLTTIRSHKKGVMVNSGQGDLNYKTKSRSGVRLLNKMCQVITDYLDNKKILLVCPADDRRNEVYRRFFSRKGFKIKEHLEPCFSISK